MDVYDCGGYIRVANGPALMATVSEPAPAAAWSAAKAFTIEREREIAEAREDVRRMTSRRDEMKQRCSCEAIMAQPEWFDVWASDERILALVQAQLSTLLVGVRTDADEWKEDGSGLTEEV